MSKPASQIQKLSSSQEIAFFNYLYGDTSALTHLVPTDFLEKALNLIEIELHNRKKYEETLSLRGKK